MKLWISGALLALSLTACQPKADQASKAIQTDEPLPTLADASAVESVIVSGMTCGNCAMHVHNALAELDGFVADDINLKTGEVQVGFAASADHHQQIVSAIESAGYEIAPAAAPTESSL